MHVMVRRLAAVLFSAAMICAGTALSPCVGRAACALAGAARMDCCTAKNGISAPSCCSGHQQIRNATPAAPEGPAPSLHGAPATQVVAAGRSCADPRQTHPVRRIDSNAAPPGGTLIAQHTLLLL